jgi:uncharacterized repeat protein (TIGR01451 family)
VFHRFTACLLMMIVCAFAWFTATASAQTCGAKLCLDISHSPANVTFVSPNSLVTYTISVTTPLRSTSTATKVVVTDQLAAGTTLVSTPPSGCSAPSTTGLITCSLGSVKPTGSNPITRTFTVRMPAAATPTSNLASISSDARANDSGNNPKDPTIESFSDTPEDIEVRATENLANSDLPNGFRLMLNTDYDNSSATLKDPQTARFNLLNLLPFGFSTTAVVDDDVPDLGFVCPTGLKCPTGGWVQAEVHGPLGRLDPFKPPSEFKIEIRHDASQIPSGLTENKYVLLHDLDYDPATKDYEQVKRRCSSNPPPCLNDVKKQSDGDFLITAEVTGNWRFR